MSLVLRRLSRYVLFWAVLLPFAFNRGPNAQVGILVLAMLWALRSPYHGVQALCVNFTLTMLNTGVAPVYGAAVSTDVRITALRMGIILVVAARVLYERLTRVDHPSDKLAAYSLLFCFVASALSVLSSPLVDVSLFKLALFLAGMVAVAFAVGFASQDRKDDLFLWMWGWLAGWVVASAPLLALPLGFIVNGVGFQGWLSQPQAAGIFLAPSAIFFLSLGFFDRLWPRLNFAVGGLASIELVATLSRNALLAAAIAAAVGIVVSYIREPRRWTVVAFLGSMIGLLILSLPSTQQFLSSLLYKGFSGPTGVSEALELSRGTLITQALQNFIAHPLVGNGFGVASDPTTMNITRDPLFGLPVSASVEKGVQWLALLEEVGVIGLAFFLLMISPIIKGALGHRPASGIALFTAALMTNNGEAALFSFGGLGLFIWMIMIFSQGDGRSRTA